MAPVSRTHLWETVLAGKWQNLGDAALQAALESAFSSGSDGYQFKARGYTYEIDFGLMKQVNATTKRERNVRRVPDPLASSTTAAVVPASAGVHVPSTVLYHAPTAGRLYTGPTTAATKTSATKTATVASKTAPPATAKASPVAPKTTAPPAAAKAAPVPSAWTRSVKAAPAATAVTKSVKIAPVATIPAPVATVLAPVALPPAAPTPTPAKKPLPHQGKVKTFFKEKGYGFIRLDDDEEVFFHLTCVSELLDGSIRANDTVQVAVAKGAKPRALEVRVKARGSIFRQMCTKKCCRDKGDRHFEDRCPLKR